VLSVIGPSSSTNHYAELLVKALVMNIVEAMNTNHASLDRLLDLETRAVMLNSMERVATVVGKQIHLDWTEAT